MRDSDYNQVVYEDESVRRSIWLSITFSQRALPDHAESYLHYTVYSLKPVVSSDRSYALIYRWYLPKTIRIQQVRQTLNVDVLFRLTRKIK